MNPEIFKQLLKEAEAELDQILTEEAAVEERRVELEKRAAKMTENIGHLAALTDDPTLKTRMAKLGSDSGMTNVVIQVLNAADEPLTVSEIKDRIEKHGFTSEKYQNILATLHITLDRLCKNDGPVEKIRDGNGKKAYQRNLNCSPFRSALSSNLVKEAVQDALRPPRRKLPNEGVMVTKPLLPPPQRLTKKQMRQQQKQTDEAKGPSRLPRPTRSTYKPVSMIDEEGKPKKVSN